MEMVPDLVFLNCCHLGKMNVGPVAYNRLAYSISRELIEIGVRCVIAAGWAVDDDAAATFAEIFYQKILHDKLEFGESVFEARRETYRKHGHSLTWGVIKLTVIRAGASTRAMADRLADPTSPSS